MISKLELQNFTVFNNLSIDFSPKINVIIGENGTGKTHLLKTAYCLCQGGKIWNETLPISHNEKRASMLTDEMLKLFLPLNDKLGDLKRHGTSENAMLTVFFDHPQQAQVQFNANSKSVEISCFSYHSVDSVPVFIPAKEVLSFMKGFTSLYDSYELSFDKTYQDICQLLDLPKVRQALLNAKAKRAIEEIENTCGGHFDFKGGGNVTFKPKTSEKSEATEYSANTMAEGFRKIGMLSRLLETGAIQPGISGPLFWDEPESNLNPKLLKLLVKILLELSRNGQQIILATHDYVLLKWFDLLLDRDNDDHVRFHILYRDDKTGEVKVTSTDNYLAIQPNPIADTYSELYDATIDQSFGGRTK